MGDIAIREALIGGDLDSWGPFEQAHNHLNIGVNTRKLTLAGTDLTLSKGRIGLYNGTQYYAIYNSASRIISLAGLTVSLWAKVELSLVAGNVVTAITSIAGQADPNVIPSVFTAAFDATKGGYYITGTKRCIGVVWITAAGACDGIVNVGNNNDNYVGYAVKNNFSKIDGKVIHIICILTAGALVAFTLPDLATNKGMEIEINKDVAGDTFEVRFDRAGANVIKYPGNNTGVNSMYVGIIGQQTRIIARSDAWHCIKGVIQPVAGESSLGTGHVTSDANRPSPFVPIVNTAVNTAGVWSASVTMTGAPTGARAAYCWGSTFLAGAQPFLSVEAATGYTLSDTNVGSNWRKYLGCRAGIVGEDHWEIIKIHLNASKQFKWAVAGANNAQVTIMAAIDYDV